MFPPLAPFMVELFAAALFLQAVAGSCHLPDALVTKSVLPTPAYVERPRTIRELSPQGGFEVSKKIEPSHLFTSDGLPRALAQKVCLRRPSSTRQLSTGEPERIG